ncbi:MAG: hypothetical protein HY920_05755 [Elusimicrobia bacterium]|nr:hypothetical protein [Elusimicrobiota bacterium]
MIKKVVALLIMLGPGMLQLPVYSQEAALSTPEDYIKVADDYYQTKSFEEKGRKDIMDLMIQAANKWPDNYAIQWRAARAVYVYGDAYHYQSRVDNYEAALTKNRIKNAGAVIEYSQDLNSAQSKTLLELGTITRKYADQSVALNPQGVEGHFYKAMGISLYAYGKSIVKALMEGLGPKYEKALDAAMVINKGYDSGVLYSAYGRYWYTLPWPKRNLKKSLQDILLAVKYNPINAQMLDFLGDTYYALGDKEKAGEAWQEAMKSPVRSYQTGLIQKLVAVKFKYNL